MLQTLDDIDRLNAQFRQHATEAKINGFVATPLGQVVYDLLVYRGNHNEGACAWLPTVLPSTVKRLAVGHTPAGTVRVRDCNNAGDDTSFLALDSALGRWFRNSGNNYCRGDRYQRSSNGKYECHAKTEQCEGQIVRIVTATDKVEILTL
jgi:hypothetical protein